MEVETHPGVLEAAEKHGARVRYEPKFDFGQIINMIPLVVLAVGGLVAFFDQKTKNEVQDERIAAIQTQAAEQKAAITASLAGITGEVKSVNNAVQTLSLQVQMATQQIQATRQQKP